MHRCPPEIDRKVRKIRNVALLAPFGTEKAGNAAELNPNAAVRG
jgi:hypothetical protein